MDKSYNSPEEINILTQYIQRNKINCYKYNYSLETSVQNHLNFEATIELSADYDSLIITNLKTGEAKYALESDPKEIKK